MNRIVFILLVLLPLPAFACGWQSVPNPPTQMLWCSFFLASFAGLLYSWRGHEKGSLLPFAITTASVMAGLGLGALYGNDDWSQITPGLAPLALLSVPWVAMHHGHRMSVRIGLAVLTMVGSLFAWGALDGKKVGGFQPANADVVSQVNF